MSTPLDTCTACGRRPTCRLAEAAVLVVARDFRGVVTSLCAACGAGEEPHGAANAQAQAQETAK